MTGTGPPVAGGPAGDSRGRWLRRNRNIATILSGLALIGYVCFLLFSNYRSERDLRRHVLFQFRQETAVRAMALRHFIDSATARISGLTTARALSAFFENRDLGMSMEYGLRQSLVPIREKFLEATRGAQGETESLFSRIVLVDGRGTLLVDTTGDAAAREAPWAPYTGPGYRQEAVVALRPPGTIVISQPYRFKGRYEGQIVAWVGGAALANHLVENEKGGNRALFVASAAEGFIRYRVRSAPDAPLIGIPSLESIPPGETREFVGETEGGGHARMLACRQPLAGTPLWLIQVAEAASILGRLTPFDYFARMSVVALALLAATIYVIVVNIRSLVLQENLDFSLLREREIQRKNEQLEVEIAERKRAQEAQARLGMAVEQAAEAIVITDIEGTILYVNPAFERVSGYAREEAVGKNPRILRSGRHDEAFYRSLWETLARGESWTGNFTNRRKDGSLYEEVAVISPVRDASGAVVNYVAVKRDVTREVQMEEHLRQVQRLEAIGKLAGGIAHDFNNLLTAINGYCEILLMRGEIGRPARTEIEEIAKAGRHAAALTRQLLAFGRKQMLQPKVLDLNAVTGRMETLLRRLIGENIDLITVRGKGLWKVKVDPGQIEQVIMNLAINARDAMPAGGKIIIETRNALLDDRYMESHPVVKAGSYVMIAVSDTGVGMDEKTRERVFEPFFTTKEQGKGTGLGLSTVYGIVKQSHGYIWAYSEPGRGATFKVYLPRAAEEEAEEPPVERSVVPVPAGSETILLAEDDELVRELVKAVLRSQGYEVLCACHGEDALAVAAGSDQPIHLLITDVVMPQMSGRELADRMARVRPGIRVLFMSGYTENAVVHQGVLDADTAFIQKPFQIEALARKVREVLEGPPLQVA